MADTPAPSASGALPARARIVIIGGGVGGASVAHHLVERGERDVLLVERAELTSGSTFHSAGLVGQLRADPALTRMNGWSADLYRRLEEAGGDRAPGWVESGSLRLASCPERLEEIRRQAAWARRSGLPLELISAEEAAALFPLMSTDGVLGAAYTPTDGQVDPARLCYALAASARAGGARIAQRTRVTAITTDRGRVTGVRTDRGDVECEVVVDCGGMFAAEIARLVGVRVPIVPMSHQYVVTEAFLPAGTGPLPSLRDPDLLVYYRQELEGLVMGGYERRSAPWTATAQSFDAVPADFNGKLLPPDWDRFDEIVENAQVRVPSLADTGVRTMVNGPEAFTPDNEFCLGETEVRRLLRRRRLLRARHRRRGRDRAGDGRVDPRRRPRAGPVAHGRAPLRPRVPLARLHARRGSSRTTSPTTTSGRPGSQRAAGGRCGSRPPTPGTRRTARCSARRRAGSGSSTTSRGTRASGGSRRPAAAGLGRARLVAVGAPEHRAAREAVALFDESSFAKIEITGPGAAEFAAHAFAGRVDGPPGSLAYTQALDDRGGVAMDVTVTRLAPDEFLVVTGTASAQHDLAWLRDRARSWASPVRIADVSGAWACFGLWGPRARDVLAPLTPADRERRGVPVPDDAGDDRRRRPRARPAGDLRRRAGLGAVLPGRVRRGAVAHARRGRRAARAAAGGLPGHREPAAGEGLPGLGLGRQPRHDSGRGRPGFRGAPGRRVRGGGGAGGGPCPGTGPAAALPGAADPRAVALGSEPVRAAGTDDVLGFVTSGGYGYTVERSIAYALLPAEIGPGRRSRCRSTGSGCPGRSCGGRCTTRRASASGRDARGCR